MGFKIGDKVRIKKDLVAGKAYGNVRCDENMTKYGGCCATITEIYYGGRFVDLDVDHSKYSWAPSMLESLTVEEIENDIKKHFKECMWLMNRFKKEYQPVWVALDEINRSDVILDKKSCSIKWWKKEV